MRIRQTFEFFPSPGSDIQDEGVFIEQDGFIQPLGRDHVDKRGPPRNDPEIPSSYTQYRVDECTEADPNGLLRGSVGQADGFQHRRKPVFLGTARRTRRNRDAMIIQHGHQVGIFHVRKRNTHRVRQAIRFRRIDHAVGFDPLQPPDQLRFKARVSPAWARSFSTS